MSRAPNGAVPPQPPAALLARALDHHRAGNILAAEALYRQILRTAPAHFDALRLLGLALHSQQNTEEALQSLGRAAKINPKSPLVHSDLSLVLQAIGRPQEALASAERALALKPDQPEALYNRGNTLLDLQRPAEALLDYEAMLRLVPNYAPALNNKGLALFNLKQPQEALPFFDRALALQPGMAIAHLNRANAHVLLRQYASAVGDLERAVALAPQLDFALGHLLFAKMQVADWRDLAATRKRTIAAVRTGRRAAVPFAMLAATDSPEDQRLCARMYARRTGIDPVARHRATVAPRDRLRIGYLSSSFGNHAIMVLLGGLLARHDPARFEIVAFSAGGDASALNERAGPAGVRVLDVGAKDDAGIAALFRQEAIDIAVDIDGFSGDTRSFALASRPAPIQVNYLGYPGTMGAPWIDYILADRIVIPEDQRALYDEQVVTLPDSYQVNDSERRIAFSGPFRSSAGLPDEGFVFSSFNLAYKITPEIFAIWMRLLGRVDGSVLWLLEGEPALQRNLGDAAAQHGIAPERIVFAPRVDHEAHLWRHRLADLFLDTLPYNAHTTASDALWAGLPVLTCQGSAFPGRVGASLLNAVGLPELIAPSLAEYEAMALDLATDPGKLAAIRERLAANRLTAPLFDTDRFRRHIEAAYTTMWDRHCQGLDPASFAVAPA